MELFPYRIILFTFIINCLSAQNPVQNLNEYSVFSPELATQKTIRVLLPEGYRRDGKGHPVIYMHDAQNLFDESASYSGEWGVDETMKALGSDHIVIGIDHGGELRIEELTPFTHPKYGGGRGGDYADFIVNTLKPHIDSTFNTLTTKEHTLMAGSSLGGLITHYSLFTYPEVFGAGIIFSPSYWYSEQIFDLTRIGLEGERPGIYMATGALEPESAGADHKRMTVLLRQLGYTTRELRSLIREGAGHNEKFWRDEFPRAMEWINNR